ncbi:MAG: hypothetical protein Q8928_13320 [Bacteroidota bacterium]|nr:hypothetical protein [Bacteroidota bacterium]
MRNILFFLLIVFNLACNESKTRHVKIINDTTVKSKTEWKISIYVSGASWDPAFRVNVENPQDSITVDKYLFIEDSISHIMRQKIVKRFAYRILQLDKDSIYSMTMKSFFNLKLPEKYIGKVLDGPSLSIEIEQNGVRLKSSFYNLTDIKNASPEIATLINFMNDRLLKDMKIY